MSTLPLTYQGMKVPGLAAIYADAAAMDEQETFAEMGQRIIDDELSSLSVAEVYRSLIIGMLEQANSAISTVPLVVRERIRQTSEVDAQRKKNQAAIALLDAWLADTSGYDEAVWPVVKEAIEQNPLSMSRHDFEE